MGTDRAVESIEAYRQRARAWLAEHAPQQEELPEQDPAYWTQARSFQAAQYAAGFAGITWPERYGGQGLTPAHQAAFNDEAAQYTLPSRAFQITLAILGMTVLEHGTEDQKKRYLPEMLRGEALWVQLLSEPSAGSDLAAVRTRADRDGEEWILNGEKVWSTHAQWSDYAMVLARTDWDAPKHAGLTMFIVPIDTPELVVHPLKQISGDEEFCQEFLDDVRVTSDAILGGENRGWAVTTSLFDHSRTMTSGAALTGPIFASERGGDPDPGRDLVEHVNEVGLGGDSSIRQMLAEVIVDNTVSGLLAARVATDPTAHDGSGMLAKLFGGTTLQRRREIELELWGEAVIGWAPSEASDDTVFNYLKGRTASVAGGTHEVLKNGIAERLLGLPRESSADKNVPFREVARRSQADTRG